MSPAPVQIVVDVEAFMASGVRFDVVNENELIIESCAENGEGNSASRKGFYRRFLFPSLVSVDTVRSVLSRDGILTITVAKKVSETVLLNSYSFHVGDIGIRKNIFRSGFLMLIILTYECHNFISPTGNI